jgi:hypothetical protein
VEGPQGCSERRPWGGAVGATPSAVVRRSASCPPRLYYGELRWRLAANKLVYGGWQAAGTACLMARRLQPPRPPCARNPHPVHRRLYASAWRLLWPARHVSLGQYNVGFGLPLSHAECPIESWPGLSLASFATEAFELDPNFLLKLDLRS